MNEHFCPEDLDRLVEGRLVLAEKRHLLAHLLRRCPQCCAALASHVVLPVGSDPEVAGDYNGAVNKAIEASLRCTEPLREAQALLAALLDGERAPSAPTSIAQLKKLRGMERIQALVETARALRYQNPREMLALAKLARASLHRLRVRELGREMQADLRALVWAELANAHRVCDELSKANQAISWAIFWGHKGSRSELLLARVADLYASLCAYERRFAEGQELLAVVYRTHLSSGRRHLAGRTLVSRGNFALWEGSPRKALHNLLQGFDLVDLKRDPALGVEAGWAMLVALVDRGRYRSARRLLWQSRAFFSRFIEPHRLRWLEARILDGLSDWERAEPAYEQARAGFVEQGQVYAAALVGLDLGALWARQHRVREVYRLAEEMIAAFRSLRVAREAIAVLLLLKRACVKQRDVLDVIDIASTLLRDLERQPARPRS